jgi:LPXTG-motif cell wall-anchored protein
MEVSKRASARPLAIIAALLLLVLSMGVAGNAFADSANGKGAGQDYGQGNGQGNASGGSQATLVTSSQVAVPDTTGSPAATAKADNGSSSHHGSSQAKGTAPGESATGSYPKSDHSQGNAGTSGEYDDPQPLSNADHNSGGANGKCPGGPYCSTRDGSPSGNGNGGGKAVGKPCAGCVGKADNKNPKGQYPDGSDHNKGYECDGNHGIGRTNPAHTGCKPASPPPPTCVPKPGEDRDCKPVPPPTCVPKPGEDQSCNPLPPECKPKKGEDAHCQPVTPPVKPPKPPTAQPPVVAPPAVAPEVLGEEAFAQPHKAAVPARPAAVVAPAAGVLPQTGAEGGLGLVGLAGFGLVVIGATTLFLRRKSV